MTGKYRDLVRQAYTVQKQDAKRRGIPFLLTYEEWCTIWMESGKFEQRGPKRGQYVMSRPGDKGAYEIGNIVICRAEENHAERIRNSTPLKGERNAHYGKNPWLTFRDPEAAKAKKRQSMIPIAAKRERNARGWFVSKTESGDVPVPR